MPRNCGDDCHPTGAPGPRSWYSSTPLGLSDADDDVPSIVTGAPTHVAGGVLVTFAITWQVLEHPGSAMSSVPAMAPQPAVGTSMHSVTTLKPSASMRTLDVGVVAKVAVNVIVRTSPGASDATRSVATSVAPSKRSTGKFVTPMQPSFLIVYVTVMLGQVNVALAEVSETFGRGMYA